MTTYFIVMGSLLGLILGSFLNALAYRLPRNESLMTRSHCTVCFKQITAWENIPVVSWIFLRGRCSGCKTPISMRYPLVEAATALIFGIFTSIALSLGSGALFAAIILLTFAFVGILIALIDLDTFKVQMGAVHYGFMIILAAAIGYQLFTGDSSRTLHGLIFMAIYGVIYGLIWLVSPKLVGFGDVKLVPMLGFVLGWISIGAGIVGFFMPSLLALLYMLPSLISGDRTLKSKIPYGPWLILGAFVSVVFGDILLDNYLRLGGI